MCLELINQIDEHNNNNKRNYDRNDNDNQVEPNKSNRISIQVGRLSVPIGTFPSFTSASSSKILHLLSRYNVSIHEGAPNNMPDDEVCLHTESILKIIDQAKKTKEEDETRRNKEYSEYEREKHSVSSSTRKPPLFIGFISGGGSALLALPKLGLSIQDKIQMIQCMVKAGVNIVELNTIRSALSQVKGGQLAQKIIRDLDGDAELVTFIISDIIGDPIEMIASGPTVIINPVADDKCRPTPLDILQKYQINIKPNEKVFQYLMNYSETISTKLRTSELLPNIQNVIIGNNTIALEAAKRELIMKMNEMKIRSVQIVDCGSRMAGEAEMVVDHMIQRFVDYFGIDEDNDDDNKIIKMLLSKGYYGVCWLGGGETTVNMMNRDKPDNNNRKNDLSSSFSGN